MFIKLPFFLWLKFESLFNPNRVRNQFNLLKKVIRYDSTG
jgi:hypothetical protein